MHKYLRITHVANALGVYPTTIRRMEKRGLVQPLRDHNGIRYYTEEQVASLREATKPKSVGKLELKIAGE